MSQRRTRPARLEDVAREAGVHVSTVSRVLNGSDSLTVRPETRERIIETARRLRYRPNAIARGLKLAATGALGLLVPSLRNPVYAAVIRGAFDRAWEEGFVVLLAEDTGGRSRPAGVRVARRRGPHRRPPDRERPPGQPHPGAVRGGDRPVRVREPPPHRQRLQRLDARGGRGRGRRRPPDRPRPHPPRTRRRSAACSIRRNRRMAGFAAARGGRARSRRCRRGGGLRRAWGPPGDDGAAAPPRPPTGVFVSNINQAVGAFAAARRARARHPGRRLGGRLRRRSAGRLPGCAADHDPHAARRARGDPRSPR